MLKKLILRFAVAFALIFPVLMLMGLARDQSFRAVRLASGRNILKQATEEYVTTGKIEEFGSKEPFVQTNQVNIRGVVYQALVAIPIEKCHGTLIMTTNDIIIWLQTNQPPKKIPATGYRPPFFSLGL